MKRKIISWVLIFAVVLGFVGLTQVLKSEDKIYYGKKDGKILASKDETSFTESVMGSSLSTVAENDSYIMYIDESANLVMQHRATGRLWNSAVATSDNSKFSSSLIIDHYIGNQTQKTLYSSENCVDLNQAKIFKTNNGFKIEYILGEIQTEYLYPKMISKKRMEKLFENIEQNDIDFLERRYSLYELDSFSEEDKKTLIYQYPKLKEESQYIMEEEPTKVSKERLHKVFKEAGYTERDLKHDNEGLNISAENPQTFKISVNYKLTDTGFKVSVETKDIEFYKDYPIKNINILPFFDSYSKDDNGYFVLPSGSGALMRAETNESTVGVNIPIYGNNLAAVPDYRNKNELCTLPVFGQYKNNSGYMCIVDDSAQQATITVDRNSECSAVSVSFGFIDTVSSSLSTQNNVTFFSNKASADVFSAEYILMPELSEETAYSYMAKCYRERLINNGELKHAEIKKDTLLLAEVVNVINYDDSALGFIPVNKEYAVTDYEQTTQIVNDIAEYTGSDGVNLLLTGWNNKGVNRQKLGYINLSSAAGGRKSYTKMANALKNNKITTYIDLNFTSTETFPNDGFSPSSNAVRDITNSIIKLNAKKPLSNNYEETTFRLINPDEFLPLWQGYSKNSDLLTDGVYVSDLTSILYSNFSNNTMHTRGDSVKNIQKTLAEMKKSGNKVLGDGGNLYTLKYMDFIFNLPSTSDNSSIYYRDIPFVQMVLHGNIQYSAELLNNSANPRSSLLKLIETGSNLNYRITANKFDKLFSTDYSYLYSTNYTDIKDSIRESYLYVSEALKGLGNSKITEHIYITDEVVKITYDNNTVIYINYGKNDYVSDILSVKAESYVRFNS